MGIKHSFQSGIADGVDTTLVRPSNWNADHVCTDGAILGKVRMTPEGGVAIQLTNKTGVASVKGTLVSASATTDNAFELQSNELDTFGVVYEAGIADGSECWVVISGRAQVLLKDTTASTRKDLCVAADTDGRALSVAMPTTPPSVDQHWKECGHFIESKVAGTSVLAYAMLHFN